MATQYDVKPGTFETITGESIGSFTINVAKNFILGGKLRHLMADPVIKQGGVTVPPSAYTLLTDSAATTQESAYTGATLYGGVIITNATYAGVELTIDGKNYGGYNSNESLLTYIDSVGADNTAPGSDAFIEDGEIVQFDSDTGLSIVSENTGEIALWDAGTSYSVAGTLSRKEGFTVSATGRGSNQNKNPLLAVNNSYWYVAPAERDLIRMANANRFYSELHPIHDRAGSYYNQYLKVGKKDISGTQYEFFIVHLDGSVVTGNTNLENILGVGETWQNPFIDILAPDVAGTRTLVDMGGDALRFQEASGDFATVGGKVADQFQGHWHTGSNSTGIFTQATGGNLSVSAGSGSIHRIDVNLSPTTDGVHGTPRTGTRTYGPSTISGAAYIIAMAPAA